MVSWVFARYFSARMFFTSSLIARKVPLPRQVDASTFVHLDANVGLFDERMETLQLTGATTGARLLRYSQFCCDPAASFHTVVGRLHVRFD